MLEDQGKARSFWIPGSLYTLAEAYAKKHDLNFSQVVRKALRMMLEAEEGVAGKNPFGTWKL